MWILYPVEKARRTFLTRTAIRDGKGDVLLSFWFPARIVVLFLLVFMILPHFNGGASLAAYGLADATATLTEWTIPTAGSAPAGLALDPSGSCCWFVESSGNKVAHLDVSTSTFREWAIPTSASNPTGLALTSVSGSVVVVGTESAKNTVFVFFPSTGLFREYVLPEEYSGPQHVSIEPDGTQVNAWFTERRGNWVGELVYNPSAGTARLNQLILPPDAGSVATGVHAVSGIIWFAGSTAMVRWDRSSSRFAVWATPVHRSLQPAFVDLDALGQVWYTSTGPGATSTDSYVGVLRSDNTFTEWLVPTGGAGARAISIDPVTHGPWTTERGEDKIAKLDPSAGGVVTKSSPTTTSFAPTTGAIFTHVSGPVLPSTITTTPATSTPAMSATGQFTEWTLPTGSGPDDLVVDAQGDVWILEPSADRVARFSLASDFVIGCDPSSLILVQGLNVTSTCTVTSIDGFASDVQLVGSWLGAIPVGVAYTLPSPVSPPPGRGVSSSLIISASPTASTGVFTFRVNGTSGLLAHGVYLEVTITAGAADFAITANPSYLSIPPDGSDASSITVQSLGVFFSPVGLSVSGAPQGLTLVFGTNPVTPPIGGTTSTILTVHVSGAVQGTYSIAIVGTGGTLTRSTMLTVQVTGGPCLIATATYGSELSDEVQFLRNFRDRSIMKTSAGSNFMIAFNAWYYSFSPTVAQFIRENLVARTATKLALYPLIGILRLGAASFYVFPMNLEASAVLSGIIVSSLIGIVYVAVPLAVLLAYSRRSYQKARRLQTPILLVLFAAFAAVAFMTVLGAPAAPMVIATSTIVLASLSASALFASQALLHMVRIRTDAPLLDQSSA